MFIPREKKRDEQKFKCYLHEGTKLGKGTILPEQNLIPDTNSINHFRPIRIQHLEKRIVLPLISRLILVDPNRQHNLHSLIQSQRIDRLEGQVGLVTVHAIESDTVSDLGDEHHVV